MFIFDLIGSYGNERYPMFSFFDHTYREKLSFFSEELAVDSLPVIFHPFAFPFTPVPCLTVSYNHYYLLAVFHAPLPVFPAAPCKCFSPSFLSSFTPLPVFLRLLACHPFPVFYAPLPVCTPLLLPAFFHPRLSLFFPLPVFFINPFCFFTPSCLYFLDPLACLSLLSPIPVFFEPPFLSFYTPFCLFFPSPCL